MHNSNQFTDDQLLKLLRHHGYIVPDTEEDVEEFEEAIKQQPVPPLPDEVRDPNWIIGREYSKPMDETDAEMEKEITNFARAARQGKTLPDSVLEKMKKDRENAQQNKT